LTGVNTPDKAPSREYRLVVPRAVQRPDRTVHVDCGCVVGIAIVDGESMLLDAVGSERLDDGRIVVLLDLHDCDRARATQRGGASPISAGEAAGRVLAAVREGVAP
jgi:hypothetical protein